MFKPETIEDLAICLSVIRPIARESRKEGKVQGLIYDDDAIDLIKDYFKENSYNFEESGDDDYEEDDWDEEDDW